MQHIYSHQQQQFPGEWTQSHHQHPTHHVAQQHVQAQAHAQAQAQAQVQAQAQAQAQAQVAAAAAAAAQQQHYTRIAGANGVSLPGEQGISEENRRVLDWIAQLMKPATRETALLELSKKREQVPELALILWHSFGILAPRF